MERWVDIGPLLQAARADMQVGQLIHGEAFSLFEAMSALEAGNPKMDAAASPSAERPTLAALLADPTSSPWDLPLPTLLTVLDQLLAMEASWHSGGSAMQTVYACLYMLKLDSGLQFDSLAARALYAYCRTLQCDCAAVRDLVMSAGVCEEEDINVLAVGIPFEPPAGAPEAAVAALDAAITALMAAPEANGTAGSGSGASTRQEADIRQAVAVRLQYRRAVHLGLRQTASGDPREVAAAGAHFTEARGLVARVRQTATLLPPSTTAATASPSPASTSTSPAPIDPPLAPGFVVEVNRHLLGPSPPRRVQIMSLADALSYTERLMDHLAAAVALSEHVHDYRSLQLYLWRFARSGPGAVARSALHALLLPERWQSPTSSETPAPQQPGASGSREGAKGNGGGKGGRKGAGAGGRGRGRGGQGAEDASCSQPQLPSWVPSKEMIAGACQVPYRPGLLEEAELFFEQAVIALSNVCQALLMNRCRCRRRLRRCLDDWLNMFHHAYNAELTPGWREVVREAGWRGWSTDGQQPEDEQGPLTNWVEIQMALTGLHHLLLGFELELYEPAEYDMIYWYCDYLTTCCIAAVTARLQRCPAPQPPKPLPPSLSGTSGPTARGRGLGRGLGGPHRDPAAALAAHTAAVARYEREQLQLRYEFLEVEAVQQLAQGMLRLMAGLMLAGAVPSVRDSLPFNGGAERFQQRFACFGPLLRPPPLSYEDYTASMDPGGKGAVYLLALAGASFKEARSRCLALKSFAPSPEVAAGWVRGMERVAASNCVAAGVLAAKLDSEGKVKWECDWAHHPYFPAIVLPKTLPVAAAAAAPPAQAATTGPPTAGP